MRSGLSSEVQLEITVDMVSPRIATSGASITSMSALCILSNDSYDQTIVYAGWRCNRPEPALVEVGSNDRKCP